MDIDEIKEKLHYSLTNAGIYVDNDDELISDYIPDSIVFVSLIVQIECQLDIELPDEIMDFERLGSVNSLSIYIHSLMSDDKQEV